MSFLEAVQRLGRVVETAWRGAHRDERALPEIAVRALAAAELARFGFDDAVEVALGGELPVQADLDFGQPPVTLYRGERLLIEVLFWADALLSIHRHRFGGAFLVLEGSSIHTRYRFEESRRINSSLLLGRVEFLGAELLRRGTIRPIEAGAALIHATYHLERPSATIVVRTVQELEKGPPYDYRCPNVAFDPDHGRRALVKRLEVLGLLALVKPEAYAEAAAAQLGREDLFGCYLILEQAHAFRSGSMTSLVAAARDAHGDVIDALLPSLAEQNRLRELVQLRSRAEDDEIRFFVAALANVPSRRAILELVAARFPGRDPVDLVVGWLPRLDEQTRTWCFGRPLDEGLLAVARDVIASEGAPRELDRGVLEALRKLRLIGVLFKAE
jgi:hypothetical protein